MLFGDAGAVHTLPSTPQQFGQVQVARVANRSDSPELNESGSLDFMQQFSDFSPVLTEATTEDPIRRQMDHFFNAAVMVQNHDPQAVITLERWQQLMQCARVL